MAAVSPLTPDEVRLYIKDSAQSNYLLDGEEFSDERINFAMQLTVDFFNMVTPVTTFSLDKFPSKSILLMGTLANMFKGQAALAARNQMSYSDGGVSLPIEERFQLYQSLAAQYGQEFSDLTKLWKIQYNMEAGWGGVGSDFGTMPMW